MSDVLPKSRIELLAENSRLRSQLEDRDAEIVSLRKLDQHLTQAAVDREQRLREAEEALSKIDDYGDSAIRRALAALRTGRD